MWPWAGFRAERRHCGENNRRQAVRMQIFFIYIFFLLLLFLFGQLGPLAPTGLAGRVPLSGILVAPLRLLIAIPRHAGGELKRNFFAGGACSLSSGRWTLGPPRSGRCVPSSPPDSLSARPGRVKCEFAFWSSAHLLPVCGSSVAECRVTARSFVLGSLLSVPLLDSGRRRYQMAQSTAAVWKMLHQGRERQAGWVAGGGGGGS